MARATGRQLVPRGAANWCLSVLWRSCSTCEFTREANWVKPMHPGLGGTPDLYVCGSVEMYRYSMGLGQ